MDPDVVAGRGFRNRLAAYRAGEHCRKAPEWVSRRLLGYDRRLRLRWHPSATGPAFDSRGCRIDANGRWALWCLTPRYVPMGTLGDGVGLVVAMDVPQLVVVAQEADTPPWGILDWIGPADTRTGRGTPLERLERMERAEDLVVRRAKDAIRDRAREATHHWNWQGASIHGYVPESYDVASPALRGRAA